MSGQTLRFYCFDCDTGVCFSCTDLEHRDHDVSRMADAADAEREELKELVDKAQVQVNKFICRITIKTDLNPLDFASEYMLIINFDSSMLLSRSPS